MYRAVKLAPSVMTGKENVRNKQLRSHKSKHASKKTVHDYLD
ncbi:hypothetical protein STRIC_0807 [Streptococcus ictaluri 707-05]|uniref:Uncharacterized protein n=1 Tax=Streptococcus ictaluri 707-05 TaxID=764299 RepID=G5JZU3_9STRE|nr:hypothetical protein STRIC_0807 [Streptococcus ictaluri 707-05]